jgi:hypothetical protein
LSSLPVNVISSNKSRDRANSESFYKFSLKPKEESVMKSAWKLCLIAFLATSLVAQTSTEPKPKKAKAATITAADVQALKDAIAAQQAALASQEQQIQALQDELHRKDQAAQQAQASAADAAAKADAAQAQASQDQQAVVALKSDVTDLKTTTNNTAMTVQESLKEVKNVSDEWESPSSLHLKGITITPSGFAEAAFVRRSRELGADLTTPFNSLTMPGASQSDLSEFFGSARQSRASVFFGGRLSNVELSRATSRLTFLAPVSRAAPPRPIATLPACGRLGPKPSLTMAGSPRRPDVEPGNREQSGNCSERRHWQSQRCPSRDHRPAI